MLAAGLLAHCSRGARQRGLGHRVVAAATAAWRLLSVPVEGGPSDDICGRLASSGGSVAGSFASSSSFSSSSSSSSSSAVSSSRGVASNTGSSSGSSGRGHRKRGPRTETSEPQPQLQAWLQEQGLPAPDADQHARRLAHIFGSQQAALESLPATFEWCCSRGLPGLQTAQLLDRIAKKRHQNVVQFTALVQPVWQLLDSHIAAHIEPLRQAGARLPKHTSLAEVLCSSSAAAQSLGMPPDHVEAWLAAVGQRLPAAAIGRLLLSHVAVVSGSPTTPLAAIGWAACELGVTDPAAFFGGAPTLLRYDGSTLQRNLDSLQRTLGGTAEAARQLVLKRPSLLAYSPNTVQAALAWLRRRFPDPHQLADIIGRGSHLLGCSVQHLQANADYLQQELGWQDGDGQLAVFVAARPSDYAVINLTSEETEHKLQLLGEVVGANRQECLMSGIGYLNRRLDSIAARYVLVLERAPELLRNKAGELHLSWIMHASDTLNLRRLGMTRPDFNAFLRQWPRSEEGRRLLEGLRAGSVEGWPRPPSPEEAQQRQQAAQQRQQQQNVSKAGPAAAKRGRGRPRKAAA